MKLYFRGFCRCIMFLYLLNFNAGLCLAQQQDSFLLSKRYLSSYLRDTRDLLLSPGNIQKKDHDFVATALLLIPAGFMLDESIEMLIRRQQIRPERSKWLNLTFSNWGNGIYPGTAALVLYGVGAANKRDDLKWIALLQIKTIGLSAAASRVPKLLFQRKRPDENIPVNAWNWNGPFKGLTGDYSFTSGHTFIAFSWAAVTASSFKEKKGVAAGVYAIASLVGLSRVYKGEHWSSDVIGGAVLGYALGKLTYRLQEKNWTKKPHRNFLN